MSKALIAITPQMKELQRQNDLMEQALENISKFTSSWIQQIEEGTGDIKPTTGLWHLETIRAMAEIKC